MTDSSGLFETFVPTIERDAAVMMSVAEDQGLEAPVPSCPGWTLRDLLVHTGRVHRHKTEILVGDWRTESPPQPDGPGEADVIEWFGVGVVEMIEGFRAVDLDEPRWTWCPHEHTGRWWVRRMAHETAIHAADAILAADGTPTLAPDLAADGVDEILEEMMVGAPDWGTLTDQPGVVAMTAGERTWTVRRATFSGTSPNSGTTYTDLPALAWTDQPPDARVVVDPSTLDLWLWGRAELGSADIVGDPELVAHVRAVAADATQ
jgi:uncharacterized protein (TIGR03083 family)